MIFWTFFLSGLKKQGHEPLTSFNFTYSKFDNIVCRHKRRETDKIASSRAIFETFITQCKTNYSIREFMTIDEMLVAFRGRCSFIQYNPKKPAK